MAVRITQDVVEVLGDAPANARITQAVLEVLGDAPANARITQVALEVVIRDEQTVPGIVCINTYYSP